MEEKGRDECVDRTEVVSDEVEGRIGLVVFDVRVREENACVRDDCGFRTIDDGMGNMGRRRRVVKALDAELVERSGWEGHEELTVGWGHGVCELERACFRRSI